MCFVRGNPAGGVVLATSREGGWFSGGGVAVLSYYAEIMLWVCRSISVILRCARTASPEMDGALA